MLISLDEINKSIIKKGWEYSNKKLVKSFQFNDFSNSINFVNQIANISESMNHHPEITIKKSNVKIKITSIDFNGVTTKCINLAMKVDSIRLTS